MTLVLDSGAVSFLTKPSTRAARIQRQLSHLWPPMIPAVVLVECLRGTPRDAPTYIFLKNCRILESVPREIWLEAARLRSRAGRGSAVDALVVAYATHGTVMTGDNEDISALATHARDVTVITI